MFPARAGMSLQVANARLEDMSVPRASGDEPTFSLVGSNELTCSPRERG